MLAIKFRVILQENELLILYISWLHLNFNKLFWYVYYENTGYSKRVNLNILKFNF